MFNKKRFSSLANILIATIVFSAIAGCGAKTVITEVTEYSTTELAGDPASEESSIDSSDLIASNDITENVPEESELETTSEASDKEASNANSPLPRYEYPGPELFYSVLYDYLRDELGAYFDDYDVCIPSPQILEIDDADKSDIKVYGDFWVYNYDLDGDTLLCTSGGSFPGLIHLKYDPEKGFIVTGMDVVADGSDFDASAKEIFGDKYDAFINLMSDREAMEKTRAQIIANYVADNDLSITKYQDYGWNPVTLPEENIDNFYSDLN